VADAAGEDVAVADTVVGGAVVAGDMQQTAATSTAAAPATAGHRQRGTGLAPGASRRTGLRQRRITLPILNAAERRCQRTRGRAGRSRFKDQLHEEHPGLLPTWYAFRDVRATRRAVQWLAGNPLINDEAAGRFLAGHPDPDLPLGSHVHDVSAETLCA
jgi:hypothetical protein